jgi:hypothetical protein
MSITAVRRVLQVVSVCAACAACAHEPAGPESEVTGTYGLASVDGDTLPAVLWTEGGVTLRLGTDLLIFDGRGGVTRTFTWQRDSLPVGMVESGTQTAVLQYRVRGDSVELGTFTPCPPNALCIGNDVGVRAPATLVLDSRQFFGHRLVYALLGAI